MPDGHRSMGNSGSTPPETIAWLWGFLCGFAVGVIVATCIFLWPWLFGLSQAHAGDLTAAEFRVLLARAGVNPGTTHDLGAPHGRKAIQKITVRTGKGREHYVIDLWVASPP